MLLISFMQDDHSDVTPPVPRKRVLPAWMLAAAGAPKNLSPSPKGNVFTFLKKQDLERKEKTVSGSVFTLESSVGYSNIKPSVVPSKSIGMAKTLLLFLLWTFVFKIKRDSSEFLFLI